MFKKLIMVTLVVLLAMPTAMACSKAKEEVVIPPAATKQEESIPQTMPNPLSPEKEVISVKELGFIVLASLFRSHTVWPIGIVEPEERDFMSYQKKSTTVLKKGNVIRVSGTLTKVYGSQKIDVDAYLREKMARSLIEGSELPHFTVYINIPKLTSQLKKGQLIIIEGEVVKTEYGPEFGAWSLTLKNCKVIN